MGLHRRALSLVVVAAILSSATWQGTALAQAAADAAKTSMADGDKAAKAKDWRTAASLYDAANKSAPSEAALDAAANAYYQAGDLTRAFAAYNEWTDKYATKAPAPKRKIADTRLKELTENTGGVTITVNEPNATIFVDEKQVGASPLPGQLRLTAGPHHIKVTKDGFIAFDQSPNVAPGTMTAVDAKLISANAKVKITVTDKGNHFVHVIIDGVDRGPAPYTGEIEAGAHDVMVSGTGFAAPVKKVVAELGKPLAVEMTSAAVTAPVKISTADNKGTIYIDGALVGEGTYTGELGGGTHEVKITRDGYEPLVEQLIVADTNLVNKTYALKITAKVTTQEIVQEDRLEGLYGGFGLIGFLTPGGTGSVLETQCEDKASIPTLRSCDTPGGLGGGIGGFVGYHWDPVGVELFVAGHYDQRTITNTWDSAALTGGLSADPARKEEFNIRRAGGMLLARVRLTKQWKKVILSAPIGAGVSYRVMFLDREITSIANPRDRDLFVPPSTSYVSPVIAVEPTVGYRLTPGVAVTLGFKLFLEAPGTFMNGRENPTTERVVSERHVLGTPPNISGLSTPSYELASNVQIFVGPVIGMMFGP